MSGNSGWFTGVWFAIGCWAGCWLFYWWLISKLQGQQLVAAALVGLGVALMLLVLRRCAALHFQVRLRWFGILLWVLPGKVLRDLGLLAAELWHALFQRRQATGAIKPVPFDPGQNDPASAARRALVIAGLSLPPNTIALALEPKRCSILVHQLVFRAEVPANREWPL